MAQISKGDTFADGQQVTGARLNQLVDSSVLLVGAVTDQTLLTAATVAADDQMILSDTSDAVLKKTTVGDILGSSLPIVATTITGTAITGTTVTTPVINASANSDIIVTPFDGVNVTGKPFNSPDGIVTTVSAVAHGLPTGALVQVTASNTAYSGLFKIVAINADEFTYTISPAVPLASGTCSYIRKATQRLVGNQTVSGSVIVAGNETIEGNSRVVGNLSVAGTITNSGLQAPIKVAVLTRELTNNTTYVNAAGAWTDIPYNTITQTSSFVVNSSSFTGVLSSAGTGTITLPAGTYVIDAETSIQAGGGQGAMTARIYNVTTSSVIKKGLVTYCYVSSHGSAYVFATLTLASQADIKIQYFASASGTAQIAYPATLDPSSPEVVFFAKITKLA
jgi:hypothetical protein